MHAGIQGLHVQLHCVGMHQIMSQNECVQAELIVAQTKN